MDDRIAQHLDRAAATASAHAAVPGRDRQDAVARVGSAHHAEMLGLTVSKVHEPTGLFDRRYEPSMSVVLRGRKRSIVGDDDQMWGRERFIITPVDLPVVAGVVDAAGEDGFVAVVWRLDPVVVGEVVASMTVPAAPGSSPSGAVCQLASFILPAVVDAIDRLFADWRELGGTIDFGSGRESSAFMTARDGHPRGHRSGPSLFTRAWAVSKSCFQHLRAAFLNERLVDYYIELSGHLGTASKYQFLASVFKGTRIPGLEGRVAAIQGKMGGTEYFTFMIEPSRLLKLAYVLHRNSTSGSSLNTYQRIIKRPRLKKVQAFVDGGGYFPNSLVINIDASGRPLQFDHANIREGQSRLGVLHLPQNYGAAYVIDGQHRLYGFSEAERSDSELVPVVAFVDMRPEQQVKLFMQINENQQAVPKNLRNTLNGDLLWHSDSLSDQAKALRLRLAQHLGEEKTSPLMGRIILGEDKSTRLKCISIDAITRGLDRGGFVGEFTAKEMRSAGLFYRGSIDRTVRPLSTFTELLFKRLAGDLPRQWDLGRSDGGFVFMNNGIEAILRIAGDLVAFAEGEGRVNPKSNAPRDVLDSIQPELDAVIAFLRNAQRETALELRSTYGSAGATRFWRRLQAEVSLTSPRFNPEGLEEYQRGQVQKTREEAGAALPEALLAAKQLLRDSLELELGADWWRDGLPSEVVERGHALRARALVAGEVSEAADWWDFVPVGDLLLTASRKEIAELLRRDRRLLFGRPNDGQDLGDGGATYELGPAVWLQRLVDVDMQLGRDEPVSASELEFVVALAAYLRGQAGVDDLPAD